MVTPVSILLVDDNHYMRECLQEIITHQEDMQLIGQAVNGEEAILFAEEMQPDIILMDVNMSPVNGFEATRSIREKYPAIKIIGLSLHAEPIYRKTMLELGASGYIVKSSSYEEIVTGIQKVAGGMQVNSKNPEHYLEGRG